MSVEHGFSTLPTSGPIAHRLQDHQLPVFIRSVHGTAQLVDQLRQVLDTLQYRAPLVVTGTRLSRPTGEHLAQALSAQMVSVECNSEIEVQQLVTELDRDVDAVVAVGGGKVIDVAKAASLRTDLPVVVVPTMLSADGIASPVSVLADVQGKIESHGSRLPRAVVADLELLAGSPIESIHAGMGDLIANRSAVADWRLAQAAGREQKNDFAALDSAALEFAALLALTAADLIWNFTEPLSDSDLRRQGFLERLLEGLVLSGLAMEIAGSSRPCSGAEHLISHAIDRVHPGTAMHGQQVAFGTVVADFLRGEQWQNTRSQLEAGGLTDAARGFGFNGDQLQQVLLVAPTTRPGRYTVLDTVDLEGLDLSQLVEELSSYH